MFGKPDPERPGQEMLPDLDLVRLAVPRRVYTNTHLEYVAEVTARLRADSAALRGVKIVKQAPASAPLHGAVRAPVTAYGPRYNLRSP